MNSPPANNESTDEIYCQYCGSHISEDESDYVVHRIPEHGKDLTRSVFYCGPDCFRSSMDELFS